MIKMMTAFTTEVDIAETAVAELKAQLEKYTLLTNSVGFVHCHNEFVASGVLEAVCAALPFETAGISCSLPAVNGSSAQLALTLTVLTSDSCTFAVADFNTTGAESVYPHITAAAKKLVKNDAGKAIYPALVMPYITFMSYASGDMSVRTLSEALPGVPLYGSLPISDELDFTGSYTIYNGVCSEHGGSLVAIYGDIHPTFRLTSASEGTILNTGGRVDRVEGNVLYEIDGMRAWDYIKEKGIATTESYRNMVTQPIIFKNPDGSQTMRNFLDVDFENGTIILAGDVYEGSKIDFAIITPDDVRNSAKAIASEIESAAKNASVVFLYSCATRLWTLGTNIEDEIDIISRILEDKVFSFAYSGGETVPLLVNGSYLNTFQNNNLTVCTF
jgi:hypothetical protein